MSLVSLPAELIKTLEAGKEDGPNLLENLIGLDQWVEMAQWSDILIFDFLIMDTDRLTHIPVSFFSTWIKPIKKRILSRLFFLASAVFFASLSAKSWES